MEKWTFKVDVVNNVSPAPSPGCAVYMERNQPGLRCLYGEKSARLAEISGKQRREILPKGYFSRTDFVGSVQRPKFEGIITITGVAGLL